MHNAAVVFLVLLILVGAQQQVILESKMGCTSEESLLNTYLVTSAEETHYYPLLNFFSGEEELEFKANEHKVNQSAEVYASSKYNEAGDLYAAEMSSILYQFSDGSYYAAALLTDKDDKQTVFGAFAASHDQIPDFEYDSLTPPEDVENGKYEAIHFEIPLTDNSICYDVVLAEFKESEDLPLFLIIDCIANLEDSEGVLQLVDFIYKFDVTDPLPKAQSYSFNSFLYAEKPSTKKVKLFETNQELLMVSAVPFILKQSDLLHLDPMEESYLNIYQIVADDILLVTANITGDELLIEYPFFMTDFDVFDRSVYVLDTTGVVTSFSFENHKIQNIETQINTTFLSYSLAVAQDETNYLHIYVQTEDLILEFIKLIDSSNSQIFYLDYSSKRSTVQPQTIMVGSKFIGVHDAKTGTARFFERGVYNFQKIEKPYWVISDVVDGALLTNSDHAILFLSGEAKLLFLSDAILIASGESAGEGETELTLEAIAYTRDGSYDENGNCTMILRDLPIANTADTSKLYPSGLKKSDSIDIAEMLNEWSILFVPPALYLSPVLQTELLENSSGVNTLRNAPEILVIKTSIPEFPGNSETFIIAPVQQNTDGNINLYIINTGGLYFCTGSNYPQLLAPLSSGEALQCTPIVNAPVGIPKAAFVDEDGNGNLIFDEGEGNLMRIYKLVANNLLFLSEIKFDPYQERLTVQSLSYSENWELYGFENYIAVIEDSEGDRKVTIHNTDITITIETVKEWPPYTNEQTPYKFNPIEVFTHPELYCVLVIECSNHILFVSVNGGEANYLSYLASADKEIETVLLPTSQHLIIAFGGNYEQIVEEYSLRNPIAPKLLKTLELYSFKMPERLSGVPTAYSQNTGHVYFLAQEKIGTKNEVHLLVYEVGLPATQNLKYTLLLETNDVIETDYQTEIVVSLTNRRPEANLLDDSLIFDIVLVEFNEKRFWIKVPKKVSFELFEKTENENSAEEEQNLPAVFREQESINIAYSEFEKELPETAENLSFYFFDNATKLTANSMEIQKSGIENTVVEIDNNDESSIIEVNYRTYSWYKGSVLNFVLNQEPDADLSELQTTVNLTSPISTKPLSEIPELKDLFSDVISSIYYELVEETIVLVEFFSDEYKENEYCVNGRKENRATETLVCIEAEVQVEINCSRLIPTWPDTNKFMMSFIILCGKKDSELGYKTEFNYYTEEPEKSSSITPYTIDYPLSSIGHVQFIDGTLFVQITRPCFRLAKVLAIDLNIEPYSPEPIATYDADTLQEPGLNAMHFEILPLKVSGYEDERQIFITWESSRVTVITIDMLKGGYAGVPELVETFEISSELQEMKLYYTSSTLALQLEIVAERTVQEASNDTLTEQQHILYDALLLTSNTPIYKICIDFEAKDQNLFAYKNITVLEVFANYGTAQPIAYNFMKEDFYEYLPAAGLVVEGSFFAVLWRDYTVKEAAASIKANADDEAVYFTTIYDELSQSFSGMQTFIGGEMVIGEPNFRLIAFSIRPYDASISVPYLLVANEGAIRKPGTNLSVQIINISPNLNLQIDVDKIRGKNTTLEFKIEPFSWYQETVDKKLQISSNLQIEFLPEIPDPEPQPDKDPSKDESLPVWAIVLIVLSSLFVVGVLSFLGWRYWKKVESEKKISRDESESDIKPISDLEQNVLLKYNINHEMND